MKSLIISITVNVRVGNDGVIHLLPRVIAVSALRNIVQGSLKSWIEVPIIEAEAKCFERVPNKF